MATLDVTVKKSKEASELADALREMVVVSVEAAQDGFDPASDLSTIFAAVLPKLLGAVEGLDQLDEEWKEDPAAFMRCFTDMALDIGNLWLKKEEEEPAQA